MVSVGSAPDDKSLPDRRDPEHVPPSNIYTGIPISDQVPRSLTDRMDEQEKKKQSTNRSSRFSKPKSQEEQRRREYDNGEMEEYLNSVELEEMYHRMDNIEETVNSLKKPLKNLNGMEERIADLLGNLQHLVHKAEERGEFIDAGGQLNPNQELNDQSIQDEDNDDVKKGKSKDVQEV